MCKACADSQVIPVRKPQAEAGYKVMIAGEFVVKAEAFRAVPRKTDGNSPLVRREQLTDHLPALGFVKRLCLFQPFHLRPPIDFSCL